MRRRLAVLWLVTTTVVAVLVRRLFRGPLQPGWSTRAEIAVAIMQRAERRVARLPPHVFRRRFDRLAARSRPVDGVRLEPAEDLGLPGTWMIPEGWTAEEGTLIYFHGGGYVFGSTATHRTLISRIARDARLRVLGVDYRLAPEHRFPAALDDAVSVTRALIDRDEVGPARLLLAGDSAGGGLTTATLVRLRDEKDPLPAGAVLISPWVDLADTRPALRANERFDYVTVDALGTFAAHYLDGADPRTPLASPIHADLSGLPPLLVHAGGVEVLRPQIEAFADRATRAGVDVTLEVFDGMVHVFHAFGPVLPGTRPALEHIAAFADRGLQRSRV